MYTLVTLHSRRRMSDARGDRTDVDSENAREVMHPPKYSERLAKQLRLPRLLPFQTATWTEL